MKKNEETELENIAKDGSAL